MASKFNTNSITRVVVSPTEHFYIAVQADGRAVETYSMKRARLYVPDGDEEMCTYDEYNAVKPLDRRFLNHMTHEWTDEAVKRVPAAGESGEAWYILPGFSGFNSRVNNLWGYTTKAAAEDAVLRYQARA